MSDSSNSDIQLVLGVAHLNKIRSGEVKGIILESLDDYLHHKRLITHAQEVALVLRPYRELSHKEKKEAWDSNLDQVHGGV